RRTRKNLAVRAGYPQSVRDIRGSLRFRERIQVVAAGNALRQLPQLGPVQQLAQFGLPDQDDLQQLLRGGLQVRQQPQLLQRVRRQVLRFVDDHDDAPSLRMPVEQALVEHIHQVLDAGGILIAQENAEFLADRQREL